MATAVAISTYGPVNRNLYHTLARYGGSHASHRGEQGASRKRREVKVVSKEVQVLILDRCHVGKILVSYYLTLPTVFFYLYTDGTSNPHPVFDKRWTRRAMQAVNHDG